MSDTNTQSEPTLLVMNAEILTTATANSDAFYLKASRYFSVEWENSAAVQFDALLQMQTSDGTWITATSGSAVQTNQTSQRGFVDFSPPYSRNKYRIVITNDDASTRTMKLWIHRNVAGKV